MPPLTAQSLQYGRDQMPFLAFGGTEAPRDYVAEYQSGSLPDLGSDVANEYGDYAKGAYTRRYGLIWDGENEIYDPKHREANKQMMNMTLAATTEPPKYTIAPNYPSTKEKETGTKIMKDGKVMCTPGYVLKGGTCVLEPTTAVCQPGWRKMNGVCVKNPREFEAGVKPQGSMGTAPAAVDYPMSKPSVLSMNRLRSYIQERQNGSSSATSGFTLYHALLLVVILFIVGGVMMRK